MKFPSLGEESSASAADVNNRKTKAYLVMFFSCPES
jgi:hypothetical protein